MWACEADRACGAVRGWGCPLALMRLPVWGLWAVLDWKGAPRILRECGPDWPLASAGSDMIRWSTVLLSHTLDAARSYRVLAVRGAGVTEGPVIRGRFLPGTSFPAGR